MKIAVALATLAVATPVAAPGLAQTAAPAPAPAATTPPASSALTRSLNGGPAVVAPVTTPATIAPAPAAQAPARAVAPTTAPAPAVTPPRAPAQTTPTPRPTTAAPAATPRPTGPAPATTPTAAPPAPAARPTTPPTPAATPAAPPTAQPAAERAPPPPVQTTLNAAAIAALPFGVTLPTGFQITTGRPGPDFKIYTIRRGDKAFVMIYAGPSSQFPIYSGEQAVVGGRTSVVVNEDGRRRAVEHLFQRATAPREVHVWVSSLEGADQQIAEQIAQTVDVR